MPEPRILLVEDELSLAEGIKLNLEMEGLPCEWTTRGDDALKRILQDNYDLVILDVMLPGMDGMALCRALRAQSAVPIVMLTARADEADRLAGLEIGADDYIAKAPFSPREVLARVKAVLRRSRSSGMGHGGHGNPPPIPVPAPSRLRIDPAGWRAWWQDVALDLTRNEFCLLRTLAAHPGRVYARAQLLDLLQGDVPSRTERTVDTHIKNLRRKLELAGAGDCIRSVYGVGYRYDEVAEGG